jgi:uncharacterized membrane protein YphA (DoxX/SURF4 family)
MKKILSMVFRSTDDNRSLLPRLVIGLVFLSEGIQKFLFPELVGAGRFERIGFTNPESLACLVAFLEITCGTLVLIGLTVRISSIPLLIIMLTALITTKIPVLQEKGFWQMAHDSRTDFAMTMLIIFLLIYGAGKLSVDHLINKKIQNRIDHN